MTLADFSSSSFGGSEFSLGESCTFMMVVTSCETPSDVVVPLRRSRDVDSAAADENLCRTSLFEGTAGLSELCGGRDNMVSSGDFSGG